MSKLATKYRTMAKILVNEKFPVRDRSSSVGELFHPFRGHVILPQIRQSYFRMQTVTLMNTLHTVNCICAVNEQATQVTCCHETFSTLI